VVGMVSLVVFSSLDIPRLMLKMIGGRSRSFELERSNNPWSSFRGIRSPPTRQGWFPHGGVRGGSLGRRDDLDCANPTLEQMARD
jgi:hypothetical protein